MKSYVLEVWARLCPHISPWSRPADQLNAIPEKRLKRLAFNPFTHKHDSARSPSIGQGSPSHTHTHTHLKVCFSWATRASYYLFRFRFIFILIVILRFILYLHVPLDGRSTYRALCIGSVGLCLHLSSWTLGEEHANNTCDRIPSQTAPIKTCGQLLPQGRC